MSAKLKKAVYSLVIVGGLGAVIWQLMAPPPSAYPDTEESKTGWICNACQELHLLTAKTVSDWTMSSDKVLRGRKSSGGGAVTMGGERTVFKCSTCSEFAVLRARECDLHQEWHLVRDMDGSYVGCEKCR